MPWQLDGTDIPTLDREVRGPNSLGLTIDTTQSVVQSTLRPLNDGSGKYETVVTSTGLQRSYDRTPSGANEYTFTPPSTRQDLRAQQNYLVDTYNERPLDQASNRLEVTLSLVPASGREPDGTEVSQSRESGEWLFDFSAEGSGSGAFATSKLSSNVQSTAEKSTGIRSIELVLSPEQARVIEANATRTEAVIVREIPDGSNFAVDNSPGYNTVEVTAPSAETGEYLPSGSYVVTEWETRWQSDVAYVVSVSLMAL